MDGVTPAQGFGQAGCPEYQTVVGITLLTNFMSQSQLTFLNNITAVYINLVMTFIHLVTKYLPSLLNLSVHQKDMVK